MRVLTSLLILAGASSLAACAGQSQQTASAESQAGLDKELAGLTPGKPMSCVPSSFPTLTTHAYGPTLIYRLNSRELYRNDTAGGCEGAARGDILVQVEHQGRPCAGDIIRTVDSVSHFPTGSCALGSFVPYRKAR